MIIDPIRKQVWMYELTYKLFFPHQLITFTMKLPGKRALFIRKAVRRIYRVVQLNYLYGNSIS